MTLCAVEHKQNTKKRKTKKQKMCGKKTKENEMRQRNQKTTESMGETADPRDMKRRPLRALCRFLSPSFSFSPSAWVCSTFCTSQSTLQLCPPSLCCLSCTAKSAHSSLLNIFFFRLHFWWLLVAGQATRR